MGDASLYVLIGLIVLALAFDYINGMHDSANAIATVVSTRVLSPRTAIIVAASLNFIGAFLSTAVAKTIGKGIVDPALVTNSIVAAALIGAISWNMVTWFYGIPSSSSHALIGGIVGAVLAQHGMSELNFSGIFKIVKALILSPLAGFAGGLIIMIAIMWIFHRSPAGKVNRWFKHLQIVSASFMALSHGSNDAQKVMGIIMVALVASGVKEDIHDMDAWVPLACYGAIGLGTLSGGWKIVKTMGTRITKVSPLEGVCAESSGALTLYMTEQMGIPVSTTHTITGAIIGVGATKRLSAVRWGVTLRLLWAWVLTIPVSATIAIIAWYACGIFGI